MLESLRVGFWPLQVSSIRDLLQAAISGLGATTSGTYKQDFSRAKGFSLVELLVATFMLTALLGSVLAIFNQEQSRHDFEQDLLAMQQSTREVADQVYRDVRMAGFPQERLYASSLNWTASNSNKIASGFTTISSSNLVFQGDVDNDGIVEVVEYSLSGTTLRRSEVEKNSGGSVPSADPQILAENVTSLALSYYPLEWQCLDDFRRNGRKYQPGGCLGHPANVFEGSSIKAVPDVELSNERDRQKSRIEVSRSKRIETERKGKRRSSMCASTKSAIMRSQRGIGLIMGMLILTILSLLGLGLMTSATLETRIQSNARSSSRVYYAAEAGLEEASYRMIGDSLNAIPLTQLDTATEVVYIRQNSSINPTDSSSSDYDTEYASSNFGTVTYYTTNQSSNPIPYRWVKLSRKTKRLSGHDVNNGGLTTNQDVPIYYDHAEYLYDPGAGINASKTGYPVYQLTSFARTSDGTSSKVRREISSAGFEMPGAIFFDGPNPTFADAPN